MTRRQKTIAFFVTLCVLLVAAAVSLNVGWILISGRRLAALVFGIPGDSITAIVIGVLYLKNVIPGPLVFEKSADVVTALFVIFFLANLIMIPFGWAAIKTFKHILRVPREMLMPIVMMFCIVGAFAITNSPFAVSVMLAFGVLGFLMEENGFPVAPVIVGMILGPLAENQFRRALSISGFSAYWC